MRAARHADRIAFPERLDEARRALTEVQLAVHIREAISAAPDHPPLTYEQRNRLAFLLHGGDGSTASDADLWELMAQRYETPGLGGGSDD
jgi:hypothetical protein